MDIRKHLFEASTLIAAAILCAVVANAMASRDRKLLLVGTYPNAQKVPVRTPDVAPLTATTATAPETPLTASTTTLVPVTETTATAATTTVPIRPDIPPATATAPAPPTPKPIKPAPPAAANEDPLKRFPPHPDKPYVELHGDDVAWLHARGALFLDARRTSVYEQGHVTGARSFSVWESDVDDKVNKLFEERSDPRAQLQPIVIYCSGGDCEDSHMLAQKLWGIQFNNLYVYKDGFPDWQKRGGASRTGSAP